MSELLNSLNVPSETPSKSWTSEVAEVAASEPAPAAAETGSPDPAPEKPAAFDPVEKASEAQETAPEEQDRRVPLRALQEERQKRAQYEQMLAQREQELFQMQQWAAEQQQMQQMDEQFVEPDPETDPIGALKYAKEQQREMQEFLLQQQETAAQERYVGELTNVAYNAATEMAQKVPDYQDAYKYAINSRAQELIALGTPPQAVASILQQEELRLIDTALQNRKNPAQAIYEFARARGFQGANKPVAADPVMQETRRQVAASASSGGAPASRGSVSPGDLANLNGAAFDAAWNKMFAANKSGVFRE